MYLGVVGDHAEMLIAFSLYAHRLEISKKTEKNSKKCIFPTNSASRFTKIILLTINEECEQIDEQ
jgi:hypothetical protein